MKSLSNYIVSNLMTFLWKQDEIILGQLIYYKANSSGTHYKTGYPSPPSFAKAWERAICSCVSNI